MAYDTSWDCPHKPGPQELWQESDCYWWYDAGVGVGGFHRIGQKPNAGTGQLTLFVFARDGERYVAHAEHSIVESDRWDVGHRVGTHTGEALGEGRRRFTWNEPGSAADLQFGDSFHEPRNWSKTGHSDDFMSNINSDGHLECGGHLRGALRIGEQTYEIDALAHRDRSWGFRDSGRVSMHRYRMFSGTAGPSLSFASFFLDLKDGPSMVAGFVSRDGIDEDVRGLRVATTFDADGLSPLGAVAVMTLVTGEEVRIECTAVQGFTTPVPEAASLSSDTICTFEYAGQQGFVDLELCNNPGRGTYISTGRDVALLAQPGLSASVSHII
jgi:hypothetical protein